jgi:Ca2+/Na+ antiporter
MAEISNKDKIKAAKKALDESKKLYQDAQNQYAKAEALYNKAKVQINAVKALSNTPLSLNALSPAAITALGVAAVTTLANNITPEQRAKTINDRKEALRKLERKAEQELEKAKAAIAGAQKRIDIIKQQLGILTTQRSLKQKTETNKRNFRNIIKTSSKKIKINKQKLLASLKKVFIAKGFFAIIFVFSKILNSQITRLSSTVSKLSDLVDKTNDIIQQATTRADIDKARVSRDAALASLQSAEDQVKSFKKILDTITKIITAFTILLTVLAVLPIKPIALILRISALIASLGVIIRAASNSLDNLVSNIQYERSRLLPLNSVLDQALNNDLTPDEIRDLLDTSGTGLDGGLGPVIGLEYKGFTFSILEEDNPKFVVAGNKRRFAVALDRSGFVTLQSEPSFTLDPEVLIEELRLEIDKRRLEA